jgi:hypothetical protein
MLQSGKPSNGLLEADMADTTKNWSPDWVEDWMRVPYNPMQDRAAFNFSTGGPCAAIPRDPAKVPPAEPATNSSGWQRPVELGPQPGIALIDAMCAAQDRRDRAQAQPSAAETMLVLAQAMMAQQAAIMKLLLDQSGRAKTPKPGRKR